MANQIDPNFVITADNFEGYRIVKYLGTVTGFDPKAMTAGHYTESFIKNRYAMIKMAEEMGANAIVALRVIMPDLAVVSQLAFYGTAVVIEPLSK